MSRIYLDEATPEQLRAELARRGAWAPEPYIRWTGREKYIPDAPTPDWHAALVAAGLVRQRGCWMATGPLEVYPAIWLDDGYWRVDDIPSLFGSEPDAARAWLAARS